MGVPGVLQGIIREAPRQSRIVVVGVSMEEDRIKPMVAVVKELDILFSFGYKPTLDPLLLYAIMIADLSLNCNAFYDF